MLRSGHFKKENGNSKENMQMLEKIYNNLNGLSYRSSRSCPDLIFNIFEIVSTNPFIRKSVQNVNLKDFNIDHFLFGMLLPSINNLDYNMEPSVYKVGTTIEYADKKEGGRYMFRFSDLDNIPNPHSKIFGYLTNNVDVIKSNNINPIQYIFISIVFLLFLSSDDYNICSSENEKQKYNIFKYIEGISIVRGAKKINDPNDKKIIKINIFVSKDFTYAEDLFFRNVLNTMIMKSTIVNLYYESYKQLNQ